MYRGSPWFINKVLHHGVSKLLNHTSESKLIFSCLAVFCLLCILSFITFLLSKQREVYLHTDCDVSWPHMCSLSSFRTHCYKLFSHFLLKAKYN